MRLKSLSASLQSDEFPRDGATSECYTQAEITFSLVGATIPCLRLFVEAAKTGLLEISMWGPGTTSGSSTRSHAGKEPGLALKRTSTVAKAREDSEGIQLRD